MLNAFLGVDAANKEKETNLPTRHAATFSANATLNQRKCGSDTANLSKSTVRRLRFLAKLDFATWLETRTPKQLKELADEIRKATQEKLSEEA